MKGAFRYEDALHKVDISEGAVVVTSVVRELLSTVKKISSVNPVFN